MRLICTVISCAICLWATAAGAKGDVAPDPAAPDPVALEATITRLVAFGTRHTLSDTTSDVRGIGAARRWVGARFMALSQACGGCLVVETPSAMETGARIPNPTQVQDVLAIQRQPRQRPSERHAGRAGGQ
jgi:Zn-dependent M28 family amino/carboxypeptidase